MKLIITLTTLVFLLPGCWAQQNKSKQVTAMDTTKKTTNPYYSRDNKDKVAIKDEEWKKVLSPEVYYIAREKGTERPWTSKFENFKEAGTYY
ncbi:MAG: peptide-methionine (R)-S-oxide reductase, partial [Sediminibacterium sp.]